MKSDVQMYLKMKSDTDKKNPVCDKGKRISMCETLLKLPRVAWSFNLMVFMELWCLCVKEVGQVWGRVRTTVVVHRDVVQKAVGYAALW
jgi:hypothetical protein